MFFYFYNLIIYVFYPKPLIIVFPLLHKSIFSKNAEEKVLKNVFVMDGFIFFNNRENNFNLLYLKFKSC